MGDSLLSNYGSLCLEWDGGDDAGDNKGSDSQAQLMSLRSITEPVKILELRDVAWIHSCGGPKVWTELIWFVRHHPHFQELIIKSSRSSPPDAFVREVVGGDHGSRTTALTPFDECLLSLAENQQLASNGSLNRIILDHVPGLNVLKAIVSAHYRNLNSITCCSSLHGSERIVAPVELDGEKRRTKRLFLSLRVPASHVSLALRSLFLSKAPLHTLLVFIEQDATTTLKEVHRFVLSMLRHVSKEKIVPKRTCSRARWRAHASGTSWGLVLTNSTSLFSTTRRHLDRRPRLSPWLLQAILDSPYIDSLQLTGFTLPQWEPPNFECPWFESQAAALPPANQSSDRIRKLTHLGLCECSVTKPETLHHLVSSISHLEMFQLHATEAIDPNATQLGSPLDVTQIPMDCMSFPVFRELSLLDVSGTPLNSTAMKRLCDWMTNCPFSSSCGLASLHLGSLLTSKNVLSDGAVVILVDTLPTLKDLTSLTLGHRVSQKSLAQALHVAIEKHHGLKILNGLKWDVPFQLDEKKCEHFVRWNRCGRKLLARHNSIPSGLWAVVLARISSNPTDWKLMYSFLRHRGATGLPNRLTSHIDT